MSRKRTVFVGMRRQRRFNARLPSALPGIAFTVTGKIFVRREKGFGRRRYMWRSGISLCTVQLVGRLKEFTTGASPDRLAEVEAACNHALADWCSTSPQEGFEYRAVVAVDLAPEDRANLADYERSQRVARLADVVRRDRLEFLRREVLSDVVVARLWWLDINLSGSDPDTSWQTFDEIVRPVVSHNQTQIDPVERFAKIAATLTDRLSEDPARIENVERLASLLFHQFGWASDLADEVDSIRLARVCSMPDDATP